MSNFIQFRNDRNWIYETSPYIELFSFDSIRLCPNEWYVQNIGLPVLTTIENIPVNSNFPVISTDNDFLSLSSPTNLINQTDGGDGMKLILIPPADYSSINFINFCITFNINDLTLTPYDVTFSFVNNSTNSVFYTEVYNYPGGTSVFPTFENIDIQGNEDFRIEITSNTPDGLEFNFINFETKTYEIQSLKAIDCNNQEVQIEFQSIVKNGQVFIEFRVLEDYYDELIRLVMNDSLYSNPFIVTEENKCYTSIIHYRGGLNDCYCDILQDECFSSIRLKIVEKDCEDADEFEQYREFTTGKTRSSRAKQNTYNIFTIEADKLVNDCFKEAFNSQEFYINKVRYSKVDPYSRGARLGTTNCTNAEFKVSKLDETIIFDNQL